MKKIIGTFLIASVWTISNVANAQENVSIGPVIGASVAKFNGDIQNTKWKTGLNIGGFVNYSIVERFGIKGQLTFTQLGTAFSNNSTTNTLNYLQLPILATFYLNGRGNDFRPKLFVGPYVGYLLNAKDQDGRDIDTPTTDGSGTYYSNFDGGLQFGAGFNYEVNQKMWLNVEVGYGLGLADVTAFKSNRITNQQVAVNVGLSFPFGRYSPRTGTFKTR
jgi:Outer membrane protein beta-barrel domain